jgi:probable F420-dependent oxidoreductase
MVATGQRAEELGFDSVWAIDHIIVPRGNRYGYVVEPLISLAFLAARTQRVKLGTSVIVLPHRNPILVAKQVAALDKLSNGRVILGLGAGYNEKEFGFLGETFTNRGRRFDESIRLLKTIWDQDTIDFSGEYYNIADAVSNPKPGRSIPLWITGDSDAALHRAASMGDGWHSESLTPLEVAEKVGKLRRTNENLTVSMKMKFELDKEESVGHASGSDHPQASLTGSMSHIAHQIEDYAEVGVQYLILYVPPDSSKSMSETMSRISNELLPSFH